MNEIIVLSRKGLQDREWDDRNFSRILHIQMGDEMRQKPWKEYEDVCNAVLKLNVKSRPQVAVCIDNPICRVYIKEMTLQPGFFKFRGFNTCFRVS